MLVPLAWIIIIQGLLLGEVQPSSEPTADDSSMGYKLLMAKLESMEHRMMSMQTEHEKLRLEILPKQKKLLKSSVKTSYSIGNLTADVNDLKQAIMVARNESEQFKKEIIHRIEKQENSSITFNSCNEAINHSKTLVFLELDGFSFPAKCVNREGTGWLVIQHRFDKSENFTRDWASYRDGFGNVEGEFWLGLEYLHRITKGRPRELFIEMENSWGNFSILYDRFEIGSENEGYKLKSVGSEEGSLQNFLSQDVGAQFSTIDRDNDDIADQDCAKEEGAGWWYESKLCTNSNLNGELISWFIPLRSSTMMIKF